MATTRQQAELNESDWQVAKAIIRNKINRKLGKNNPIADDAESDACLDLTTRMRSQYWQDATTDALKRRIYWCSAASGIRSAIRRKMAELPMENRELKHVPVSQHYPNVTINAQHIWDGIRRQLPLCCDSFITLCTNYALQSIVDPDVNLNSGFQSILDGVRATEFDSINWDTIY